MKKLSQTDIECAMAAVTSFMIFGILVSLPRMSNILFVASMTRFDVDRQRASFPFLLCYTIRVGSAPLVGYLSEKIGLKNVVILGCFLSSLAVGGCYFAEDIQMITILWGVTFGFSFGMGIALLPQLLSMHFSSHLDKAVGITVGSECIISFLLTFLIKYLLKNYGLSGTFLLLSGVVLHSVPAAMLIHIPNQNIGRHKVLSRDCAVKYDRDNLLKENPSLFSDQLKLKTGQYECNANKDATVAIATRQKLNSKSSLYGFRVFLNPTYILIVLIQSSLVYIFTSINTILVDVIRDHDVSVDDAVYVLNSFQAADAIGRFTLGFFTDRGYISKANFSAIGFFAFSLLLVAFIWIRSFVGLVIFVIGLGLSHGGLNMISASFVMQYVDKDCFSVAITSRCLFFVPLSFTQAPLIGFFRDECKSYNGLLYILISICCVNGFLSMMVPVTEKWRQQKVISRNCRNFS